MASSRILSAQEVPSKDLKESNNNFTKLRSVFVHPSQATKPTIRYWMPGANVDSSVIRKDMEQIAKAGYGSVELSDLPQNAGKVDPVKYGWGTAAWRAAMLAFMQSAVDNYLTFSLTIGPAWPAATPNITPDSPGAAKELVFGRTIVHGGKTFAAKVPAPQTAPAPGATKRRLVALQAWQCELECGERGPALLKSKSLHDLSGEVHDSKITWQAPTGGEWVLIAFWERGTGEGTSLSTFPQNSVPTSPQAFVVDHFGEDGAQAVVDFWNSNILTNDARDLIKKGGYSLFEDSLELSSTLKWTPNLPTEFSIRRGYDLKPLLPLILVNVQKHFGSPRSYEPYFAFADTLDREMNVYRDYQRTMSELYDRHHLDPLRRFAHSLGLSFRAQPYGEPLDMGEAAEALDVPEGENLTLNNEQDIFRLMATGGYISGNPVFSTECCSEPLASYRQTWDSMLSILHLHYAAGVNQVTVQGYPYSGAVETANWPGWSPFEPFPPLPFMPIQIPNGFSEAWGPRQPTWPDMPLINGYLSRTQTVLRHGAPRLDVAVLNDLLDRDRGPILSDPSLLQTGFSYGFISSSQLDHHHPSFSESMICIGKAEFWALVIDGRLPLSAKTLEQLEALHQSGAVVVVVNPKSDFGSLPTVEDVPAVVEYLKNNGILPSVINLPSSVQSVHRQDADTDYYFLFNRGTTAVDQQIALHGSGTPYLLNAWSGAVVPAAASQSVKGNVTIPLTLDPNDSVLIAITHALGTEAKAETMSAPARTFKISDWGFKVESWVPTADGKRTQQVQLPELHLSNLAAWNSIDGMADVVGRASYASSFKLPENANTHSVVLNLPHVEGVWTLTVNGFSTYADLENHSVAIGQFVRPGKNSIVITVSTTLHNQMKVQDPHNFASFPRQGYGVVGDVTVSYAMKGKR